MCAATGSPCEGDEHHPCQYQPRNCVYRLLGTAFLCPSHPCSAHLDGDEHHHARHQAKHDGKGEVVVAAEGEVAHQAAHRLRHAAEEGPPEALGGWESVESMLGWVGRRGQVCWL